MVMNDMTDDGKWGAEIAVDGKRPKWLGNGTPITWKHQDLQGWFGADGLMMAERISRWKTKTYIRLPADHPHYQQPQTLTAQEHLSRMEALVRRMAALNPVTEVAMMHTQEFDEARALVAEMEPVDPDLIDARQIEHDILVEHEMDGTPALRGEWDDKPGVRGVLRAIKRGRELARQTGCPKES